MMDMVGLAPLVLTKNGSNVIILHHDVKLSRCVERCGAWQVATYFRRVQVDLIYIVTL